MSTAIMTIDTLQFAKRMKAAGMSEKVSEELAEAIKETQTQSIENLVTKKDLKHAVELLEQRIIIKLGSLMAIGIGIIAALIKL